MLDLLKVESQMLQPHVPNQTYLLTYVGDSGRGRAVFREPTTRKIVTNYTNIPIHGVTQGF